MTITSDIRPEWLPVISHAQKLCVTNNGLANARLAVPIVDTLPLPIEGIVPKMEMTKGWLSVIRHLQAMCSKNRGLAVVTVNMAMKGNSPVMWEDACVTPIGIAVEMKRMRPLKVKGLKTVPELAAAISCFLPAVLD